MTENIVHVDFHKAAKVWAGTKQHVDNLLHLFSLALPLIYQSPYEKKTENIYPLYHAICLHFLLAVIAIIDDWLHWPVIAVMSNERYGLSPTCKVLPSSGRVLEVIELPIGKWILGSISSSYKFNRRRTTWERLGRLYLLVSCSSKLIDHEPARFTQCKRFSGS